MVLGNEARNLYKSSFGGGRTRIFYSHGRLEIIGNHTDHQGGVCLVAGCDLGITAAVAPNKDGAIRIVSEGYSPFLFHLDELALKKGERGTSIAILKGVLARMTALGYKLGGFSAALKSDLLAGSGLSSSAALEALVVKIVDSLYNKDDIDPLEAAKIGQYAENAYFGKPCGLLDQIGVCFGGLQYLDFADENDVKVEPLDYKLLLRPILINTGSSHANLTPLYAAIPNDMKSVAVNLLGVEKLSQSDRKDFMLAASKPCPAVSERAKLRAQHYYDECIRVEEAKKAIRENDTGTFLEEIRASQDSSQTLLANTMVAGSYHHSPQEAVDLARRLIGHGQARIMGGGFAGSILCFVYPADEKEFVKNMARYYGEENVKPLSFLQGGAQEIR